MFKKLLKVLILSLTIAVVSPIAGINVEAGVSATPGSGGSGGSGGGGSDNGFRLGKSYSTYGIKWTSMSGNVNVKSNLPYFSHKVEDLVLSNITKGYYIDKYTNSGVAAGWNRMTWEWYFEDAGFISSPGGLVAQNFYSDIWYSGNKGKFTDSDIIDEASKNGYSYNSTNHWYIHSGGSLKLDAIWIDEWEVKETSSSMRIVKATASNGGSSVTNLTPDISTSTAQYIYENAVTSVPYSGKSLVTESTHNKEIKVYYIPITITETYVTDGSYKKLESTVYSKGSMTSNTMDIEYKVKTPSVEEEYFMPYDLNRNGVARLEDVVSDFPGFSASANLKMSVDNKQSITDGTYLKTLDTNSATGFSVTVDNDQLSIPTEAEGGFDMLDSSPNASDKLANGSYNSSALGSSPTSSKTGEFTNSLTSSTKNVNGLISENYNWGSVLKGNIGSNKSSLVYLGDEKVGPEIFEFYNNWTGGTFYFKTITMGTYALSGPAAKNWWEVNYERGRFYTYGVEYSGTITISGIGQPTIIDNDFYVKLTSKNIIQPFLRGRFEAKTVAGNAG